MKHHTFFLTLLVGGMLVPTLWGQIELSGHVNRRYYLPYEPILLKIELKNNAGNSLRFKTWEDGFIACDITDEHGDMIPPYRKKMESRTEQVGNGNSVERGRVNLAHGLVLPVGTKQVTQVQLNAFYQLDKPGTYRAQIRFSHRRLAKDWRSASIPFTVKRGNTVLSRNVGLPDKKDDQIQSRTVSIVDFRAESQKIYCLQIEDDRKVYGLIRLSPHAAGELPDFEIDARSQLHILIHTEPKVFTLWVYDIDGKLEQMSNYRVLPTSQPRLYRDPDIGRVMVLGGKLMVPGQNSDMELPSYKGLQ